jgi:DNA-binding transcriptional ArsR family regulator
MDADALPEPPAPPLPPEPPRPPELDSSALRALAHPLRVQLFNLLSAYGPATATALAERLGESSGSTSYHLRQLERHGLVREDPARGSARDRWWERVPGPVLIGSYEERDPATRSAEYLVVREIGRRGADHLDDYLRRADEELSEAWQRAASIGVVSLRLTSEELAALNRDLDAVIDGYRDRGVSVERPGTRPVEVTYRAFALVDGREIPADEPLPRADPGG